MLSARANSQGIGADGTTAQATLLVSCAATLLVLINFTAPIPAVARIVDDLDGGQSAQTWILGSISLGLATSLLIAGGAADWFGRKRVFVLGAAVLALATVLCGMASGTVLLVVARVVQGVGSAAILAASLGLLGHAYAPGPERARATGLWAAMIGGGIALGPFLSGLLVPTFGWRSMFIVLAVLSILVAVGAAVWLTDSRDPPVGRLDVAGAMFLGTGIGFLVAALIESRAGWTQPTVLAFFAPAALALMVFVTIERRAESPLLDLSLLRRPDFLAATFGAFFTGAAVIGFMTYIPNAAQNILGLGVLPSAGILAVWSGVSFLAAPQARRLVRVIGARHQLVVGLLVTAVGLLTLVGIDEESSWWRFLPGLAIAGVASGVVNAALAGMAVHSVPPGQVAMGSGANNTARYLGSSVGIAVVAVVINLGSQDSDAPHDYANGIAAAVVVTTAMSLLGALMIALCRSRTPRI